MAQPLRSYDDEQPVPTAAYEKAKRQWGMSGDENQTQDDRGNENPVSARERANQAWGMSSDDLREKENSATPNDSETTKGVSLAEQDELNKLPEDDEIPFVENNHKKQKARLTRRQKGITSIVVLLIGGFGVLSVVMQAPTQLLRISDALGKHEKAHNLVINNRIGRMLYRSMLNRGDDRLLHARSRLGSVQQRVFGGMMDRLESEHGIRFTETRGPVTGNSRVTATFNPPESSPLRGRTPTITRLNVARAFGIDPAKIQVGTIGNTETSLSFNLRELSTTELSKVKTGLATHAGGGKLSQLNPKVATAINKRMFSKVLRLPSLFHPISTTSEAAGRKVDNFVLTRRERKKNTAKTRSSPEVEERKSSARAKLKSAVGSNTGSKLIKSAGAAVAIQGVMCLVKDLASALPSIYYAIIVMPAALKAIQTRSIASQYMSGQDFTAQQMGDVIADFQDSQGRSIWGAKSLNALSYGGSGSGTEIDVGARAAFTTRGSSIQGLTTALGIDEVTGAEVSDSVAGWACSTPGRIIGVVTGVAITVVGIVGGVVTGGTTTAGAVGRVAAQAVIAGTISYAVSRMLGEFVDDRVKDGVAGACGVEFDPGESDTPEDITVLDAEAYGNCLAYGARTASNINASVMGGVPISKTDEIALFNQVEKMEIAQFKEKSLLTQMFSLKEKRSLASAVLHPAIGSRVLNGDFAFITSSFLKIPSKTTENLVSKLSPTAYAMTSSYDWGFPLVSIPVNVLENPDYSDPLENANWVADNLDNLDYGRIKDCFGVEITGSGETLRTVLLDEEINPLSDEYKDADCGNLSNTTWIRTALFVLDDSIARAMDCYGGNMNSCEEVGFGDTNSGTAGTPGNLSGPITLNGHQLDASQEKWVKYIYEEVMPLLPGSQTEKIEKAAAVTWWTLKEGVLNTENPLAYSNCNFDGGDRRISPTEVCSSGRAWQVGIAGGQSDHVQNAQAELKMAEIYPGKLSADVLRTAAEQAVSAGMDSSLVNQIVNSTGSLKGSWLLRDGPIGFEVQYPVVKSQCIDGSIGWCYGTGWDTTRQYAPDKQTALQVIEELKQLFTGGMSSSLPEDTGNGYKGTDTSGIPCPSGSQDLGTTQVPTAENLPASIQQTNIRLCGVPEIKGSNPGINVAITQKFMELVAAAKQDGITLSGSSFRTSATQIELRRSNCGSSSYDIFEKPSKNCSPPTAIPGSSMHEHGLAIDFNNCSSQTTACYKWLAENAGRFGLINLPSEPWHWSTTGR